MKWREAVKFMLKGGRITRKSWLVDDYLYMKDNILFCDGGYEYLEYLQNVSGEWLEYKNKGE